MEFEYESTKHSLTNGVKYSNGNRAIRHLGVPTVSVPMGMMEKKKKVARAIKNCTTPKINEILEVELKKKI